MIDLQRLCAGLRQKRSPLREEIAAGVSQIHGFLAQPAEETRALFAGWRAEFSLIYGTPGAALSGNEKLRRDALFSQYAISPEEDGDAMPRLVFSIQTCFSLLLKCILRAALEGGRDNGPQDLILGGFARRRGIANYVCADWYCWPVWELPRGFGQAVGRIASLAARYEGDAPAEGFAQAGQADHIKQLYEAVIPKALRHALGEYYTPDWLAGHTLRSAMELVPTPDFPALTVLDPTCGSGTFLLQAIAQKRACGCGLGDILATVGGMDINPLAVLTAKTNYLLAVLDLLDGAGPVTLPILWGDILQAASGGPACPPPPCGPVSTADGTGALPSRPAPAADAAPGRQGAPTPGSLHLSAVQPPSHQAPGDAFDRLPRGAAPPLPSGAQAAAPLSGAALPTCRDVLAHRGAEGRRAAALAPAGLLLGNPPWVNWEYLSPQYRAATQHLWTEYGLFSAKGRARSFAKEDISILITCAAMDRLLQPEGLLAFVIRQAVFKSAQNGAAFRRFSLRGQTPIQALRVDDLSALPVFENTTAAAALFFARKGRRTVYPVPYVLWERQEGGRRLALGPHAALPDVLAQTRRVERQAFPAAADDPASPWAALPSGFASLARKVLGTNGYRARTGVFTGGANGVYWLHIHRAEGELVSVTNVTRRARRQAEPQAVRLEKAWVYPLLRGSGIRRWQVSYDGYILCPHTAQSKMHPVRGDILQACAPRTWDYLCRFRPLLDSRRGFAGWEREMQRQSFHAILRVGSYTFSRYKVVWKYISRQFICAVAAWADDPFLGEKPLLPSEKVMYISTGCREEAFYLCALLSARPVTQCIQSFMNPTSISAHVIDKLNLPPYDPANPIHRGLAAACQAGHQVLAADPGGDIGPHLEQVNRLAAALYGAEPPEGS